MDISDMVSLIALLVALASFVLARQQRREARLLITEEKLTSLRVLANQLVTHLRGSEHDLSSIAQALDDDPNYRKFYESSTGEEGDLPESYRELARTAEESATSIESRMDRLALISEKAEAGRLTLRSVADPAEIEEIVGILRVKIVSAEGAVRGVERIQSRFAAIEDRYRMARQRSDRDTSANAEDA